MNHMLRVTSIVVSCVALSGVALAQDTGAKSGIKNTNGSIAGVQSDGPVGTSAVNKQGPQTGAEGGVKNTTDSLSGLSPGVPKSKPSGE